MTPGDVNSDVYMMKRLGRSRQAQELSASMQFDLASSDLDDDQLDEALQSFGYSPSPGWGMSEMLDELLSRDPKTVPIRDLSSLQKKLQDQGYLTPEHPADGTWDGSSVSAFGRFDRDSHDAVRAGKDWLSAPVSAGVRAIGYTLPTSVMTGIVGLAKGIALQTDETLERGGLLGGAVEGAAIGGAIGGGGGAIAGAIIGGVGSFFRDLFGEDPSEEGQSFGDDVLDALHPFNKGEWTDPKNFFEDLGYVATAVSMVKGGGMAVGGVKQGLSTISWLRKGGIPLKQALMGKVAQPITYAGGRAYAPTLGPLSKTIGAGVRKVSASKADDWLEFAATHGLMAQTSRPLLQTINGGFTGLSTANVGGRLSAGIGSGDDDTTIESALEDTEFQNTLTRVLDDASSLVIFPSRFLPVRAMDVARGINKRLTESHMLPYWHVSQKTGMSRGQTMEATNRALGSEPHVMAQRDFMGRVSFGLWRKQTDDLAAKGITQSSPDFEKNLRARRSNLVRNLKDEWAGESTNLTDQLLAYSQKDSYAYAAWLEGLEGTGSGLDRFDNWATSMDDLQSLQRRLEEGALPITVVDQKSKYITNTDFEKTWRRAKAKELTDGAKRLRKQGLNEEADKAVAEAKRLRDEAKTIKTQKQKRKTVLNVVNIRDDARGLPGYQTKQMLIGTDGQGGLVGEYQRLAFAKSTAAKAAAKQGLNVTEELDQATMALDEFTQDLYFRNLIDEDMRVMAAGSTKVENRVVTQLTKKAKYASSEVEGLDQSVIDNFASRGYRVVASGEDMLFFDDIPKKLAAAGVDDFAKRPDFWDTIKWSVDSLGLGMNKHMDRALFQLREGHSSAELSGVLAKHGVKMTGRQALKRLHNYMTDLNHKNGTLMGPIIWRDDPKKWWQKVDLYRVDLRELSPDHIEDALKLGDFLKYSPADEFEVANEIFSAVKRGAALGAEADFRNPIDTLRMLGRAMRVSGLPGYSDFMRTWHLGQGDSMLTGAAVGTATGITLGAMEEDGGWEDIVKGGVIGGALGAGGGRLTMAKKFPKGSYGYLPDHLHRANMALRYSLSFTFDAGRYIEQNMLGVQKGMPVIMNPKRYITKHFGEGAWQEAIDTWDEVNGFKKGHGLLRVVDDTDRRMFQRGLLGFTPRYHEAAQAYIMKNVYGWGNGRIESTLADISRYGMGRAAAEKSMNFVFFPFSFQKKLIGAMGDFIFQAPARAMLIHEGLRLTHEAGLDDRFGAVLEKHLPIIDQFKYLNNLAQGISPGRFFLEGVSDHDEDASKAAQFLTSAFVPSGAATPVAQTAGGVIDAAIHVFSPQVLADESAIQEFTGAFERYIPLVRDAQAWAEGLTDQFVALSEGAAPFAQMQGYLDEKRANRAELQPLADALGYASVDGLLQSEFGASLKAEMDVADAELGLKYPTGERKASEFTNSANLVDTAIYELGQKAERSAAEDKILELTTMQAESENMADLLGMERDQIIAALAPSIRDSALELIDDKEFVRLWNRIFKSTFGPIERVAA